MPASRAQIFSRARARSASGRFFVFSEVKKKEPESESFALRPATGTGNEKGRYFPPCFDCFDHVLLYRQWGKFVGIHYFEFSQDHVTNTRSPSWRVSVKRELNKKGITEPDRCLLSIFINICTFNCKYLNIELDN